MYMNSLQRGQLLNIKRWIHNAQRHLVTPVFWLISQDASWEKVDKNMEAVLIVNPLYSHIYYTTASENYISYQIARAFNILSAVAHRLITFSSLHALAISTWLSWQLTVIANAKPCLEILSFAREIYVRP